MIIKRFKIGLKRLAAGVFALLALSSTAQAGEKALADGIRDYNNWIIMGGATIVGSAAYGVGWLVSKYWAEATEATMNLNTPSKKAAYRKARRIWLASLVSAAIVGTVSGVTAYSVTQNDEYNGQAKFAAGVLGAGACCVAAKTIYTII